MNERTSLVDVHLQYRYLLSPSQHSYLVVYRNSDLFASWTQLCQLDIGISTIAILKMLT